MKNCNLTAESLWIFTLSLSLLKVSLRIYVNSNFSPFSWGDSPKQSLSFHRNTTPFSNSHIIGLPYRKLDQVNTIENKADINSLGNKYNGILVSLELSFLEA